MAALKKLLIPSSIAGVSDPVYLPPKTILDPNGNEITTVQDKENNILWKKVKLLWTDSDDPKNESLAQEFNSEMHKLQGFSFFTSTFATMFALSIKDTTKTTTFDPNYWTAQDIPASRVLISILKDTTSLYDRGLGPIEHLRAYYGESLYAYVQVRSGFYITSHKTDSSWGSSTGEIPLVSSLENNYILDSYDLPNIVGVKPKHGDLKLEVYHTVDPLTEDRTWNYEVVRTDTLVDDAPQNLDTANDKRVYYKDHLYVRASPKTQFSTIYDNYYLPKPHTNYEFSLTRTDYDYGLANNYFTNPTKGVLLRLFRTFPLYFWEAPVWTAKEYSSTTDPSVILNGTGYSLTAGAVNLNKLTLVTGFSSLPFTVYCSDSNFTFGGFPVDRIASGAGYYETFDFFDFGGPQLNDFSVHPWDQFKEATNAIEAAHPSMIKSTTGPIGGNYITITRPLPKPAWCYLLYNYQDTLYKLDYCTGTSQPILESDFALTVSGSPKLTLTRILSNMNGSLSDWETELELPTFYLSAPLNQTVANNTIKVRVYGYIYNHEIESRELEGEYETLNFSSTGLLLNGISVGGLISGVFDKATYDAVADESSCRTRDIVIDISWEVEGKTFTKSFEYDELGLTTVSEYS